MTSNIGNYTFTSTCATYYRSLPKKEAINRLKNLDKCALSTFRNLLKNKVISNIDCIYLSRELIRVENATDSVKKRLVHTSAKRLFALLEHFPLLSHTRLSYLPKDVLHIIARKIAPSSPLQLPQCLEVMHFLNPTTLSFLPKDNALISWMGQMNCSSFDLLYSGMRQEHILELCSKTPSLHMTSIPYEFNKDYLETFIYMHRSLKMITIMPSLLVYFIKFQNIEEITLKHGSIRQSSINHLAGFKSLKKLRIQVCTGYTEDIHEELIKLNLDTLELVNFMR